TLCVMAQNVTVQGTVKDNLGEPLIGVVVSVENTTQSTRTDQEGRYKISAPSKGKLMFSYIGFTTLTEPVLNRSTVNVVLKESIQQLDEVMVQVGYASMKRSDLTGSVSSITSASIESSVPTTLDQVLQGRVAGMEVAQNSGIPGGGSSMQIRGVNSISSSNEPIYVVDGVIISGQTGDN